MPPVPTKTGNEVRKGRILIVDDDPDITNSYSLCLEDTGLFEVDTYYDTVEALSNFKANSYDLVLLDIRMPKVKWLTDFYFCLLILHSHHLLGFST